LKVTDIIGDCPAEIQGENPVYITLHDEPEATIFQTEDTLCASFTEMDSYQWYFCGADSSLANTQCFRPTSSGCYCVKVSNEFGCPDTACFDFIINALPSIERNLVSISPVPSDGTWSIGLPDHIVLPVEWMLIDLHGKIVESGKLAALKSTLQLNTSPSSGMYYLKFLSAGQHIMTSKVIIQTN